MAIYIIIGVILVVLTGFFFAFPSPKKTYNRHRVVRVRTNATAEQAVQSENRYYDLRRMALKMSPDLLGLKNMGRNTQVFGVVVDWYARNGIVTVVAYQTGDASMYISSGGGLVGGGLHRAVRNAVIPLVKHAQDYLTQAKGTVTTLLPDKDNVGFYLLTNNGTFYAQEELKNIENESSDWCKLFTEANKVLSRLQEIKK